jgi:16S rRNA (cytidine1402-2'-O)-methyltransferase
VSGRLVLVATPIGNLSDLSPRSIEELANADAICCEDTRRTSILLQHAGIGGKRLIVTNEHTEVDRVGDVLALLADGASVAVVTDAGTPGISDPGERLVRAALAAGHDVASVPGPAAAVAALVVSGLPTARFVFEGFLPRKGSARRERLDALVDERRTLVLYEAPHRLARTLAELRDALGGDRTICVARELTKRYEELWRGTLAQAAARANESEPRGEHVLVIGGAPAPEAATTDDVVAALRQRLAAGVDRKTAVAEVAAALRAPKREVYAASLGLVADG